ncbi:hypothetical protein [Halochromatium roseum]|jgi:hypothetical protein|uniref:hypothetical protein n=1 Tax=Halochromatium roseum TaxID=391920 RepID=UPI001912DEAB|nr:hypothetical protein [Halochromatium roseum]MBK5939116.1 hypothetical protein [Halochromatium roseum]
MIDPSQAIAQTIAIIEAAPESAAALTLYALVTTLEYDRAGRLFKLSKLGDLSAEQRQIAYGLMERSVVEGIGDPAWVEAKARIDRAIRGV